MTKPVLAIIGRPNVGKSTLFNRIIKKKIAIVDDMPGITRDRIYFDAEWGGSEFTVIDTGGIVINSDDDIEKNIFIQVELALEEADSIIFVTDMTTGVTDLDLDIARYLHKKNIPVVVAVNKIDNEARELAVGEFYKLGLGEPIGISALNSRSIGDLLDRATKNFPYNPPIKKEENAIYIAIIGKPNVGKSSLVNSIVGEYKVMVDSKAGTTRDPIDTKFHFENRDLVLIDTAGLRRKTRIIDRIEYFSALRAQKSIERADVCLLVIDIKEGLNNQDAKIAQMVHDQGKGLIFVLNKWDLVAEKSDKLFREFQKEIKEKLPNLDYAPIINISALEKIRITKPLKEAITVYEERKRRISTGVLNKALSEIIAKNPPFTKTGRLCKVFYATQVDIEPPTFVIFMSRPEELPNHYIRYIINQFYEIFKFKGTPIKVILRKRKSKKRGEENDN